MHPIVESQVESAETRLELEQKRQLRIQGGWIPVGSPHEVRVQLGPKLSVRRYVQKFQLPVSRAINETHHAVLPVRTTSHVAHSV